jgi:hypothetical protein
MGDKSQNSADQWRSRGELKLIMGHSIFVIDEGAAEKPIADRVITQSTGLAGRLRNKSLAP